MAIRPHCTVRGLVLEREPQVLRRPRTKTLKDLPKEPAFDKENDWTVIEAHSSTTSAISYGTLLGATYASLFPQPLPRAGARRADRRRQLHQPARCSDLGGQSAGFERALGRFFQACAPTRRVPRLRRRDHWQTCRLLIEQADATRLPAAGYAPGPAAGERGRPSRGADRECTLKEPWGDARAGRCRWRRRVTQPVRELSDEFRLLAATRHGAFGPGYDPYFTIGASEQRYPRDIGCYLDAWRRRLGHVRPL